MNVSLGNEFVRMREKVGMKQKDAAKALGISVVHLNRIEKDKSLPSLQLLQVCHFYFGFNPYVEAWNKGYTCES